MGPRRRRAVPVVEPLVDRTEDPAADSPARRARPGEKGLAGAARSQAPFRSGWFVGFGPPKPAKSHGNGEPRARGAAGEVSVARSAVGGRSDVEDGQPTAEIRSTAGPTGQ